MKKRRTRKGKADKSSSFRRKSRLSKGTVVGQKRVLIFFLLETNITLQTKHIPIKIKERKTENVIKKNLLLWP